MDDLSTLLLAAIEETERLANDARGLVGFVTDWWDSEALHDRLGMSRADALHIHRQSPSSVLRRCAADKRQVERHARKTAWIDDDRNAPVCACCGTHYEYPVRWPCPTLLDLAEGYGLTDHQEGEA